MQKKKEIGRIRKIAVPILKRNNVIKAGIFGYYARADQRKKSDIDILVKTSKGMSLLGFSHLKSELEDALKKKVDLVEYDTIKLPIRSRILDEEVRLL